MIIDVKSKTFQPTTQENTKSQILPDFLYAKKPLPNTSRGDISKPEQNFIKNFSKILKKTLPDENSNIPNINSDKLNHELQIKNQNLLQTDLVDRNVVNGKITNYEIQSNGCKCELFKAFIC